MQQGDAFDSQQAVVETHEGSFRENKKAQASQTAQHR
jgi:hypothetical protein